MNSSLPKLSRFAVVVVVALSMATANADFEAELLANQTEAPANNPFQVKAEEGLSKVQDPETRREVANFFNALFEATREAVVNAVKDESTAEEAVDKSSGAPTVEVLPVASVVPVETKVPTPETPVAETTNKKVSFQWLNKETALKFGAGAIAVVAIGGVTYVLYENGTLKKIADAAKANPRFVAAGGAATVFASVVGVLIYTNKISVPSVKLPAICTRK